MKRKLALSILLVVVFFTALCGSMAAAANAFINLEQYEQIEDISLEDVVPLDPFLCSLAGNNPELRKDYFFETQEAKITLITLIQNLAARERKIILTFDPEGCTEIAPSDIWLKLGNLRL